MEVSRTISKRFMSFITRNIQMDNEKAEIIEYGLIVFISTAVKLAIIYTIAFWTGLSLYISVSIVAFGLLRNFAGGIHAKTPLSCLISMIFIYFGTTLFSVYVILNTAALDSLFFTCFVLLLLYSPSDVAEKPIFSVRQRKSLKRYSISLLILFVLISLLNPLKPISDIIALSCLLECITLTPFMYRITNSKRGDMYEKELQ